MAIRTLEDVCAPPLAGLLIEADWPDKAACKGADADLFFPERGASTRKAKAICAACEVKGECLDYAIEMGEKFGIWGGLNERDRRKVRKGRAA